MSTVISVELQRNSKHDTVPSKRLLDCISAASVGAWQWYLGLDSVRQQLIKSIELSFELANDGCTPIHLLVAMKIEAPIFSWNRQLNFPLYQFTDQEPVFLQNSVYELLQKNFKEALSAQQHALAEHATEFFKKLCL